jgi:hypothetical protein
MTFHYECQCGERKSVEDPSLVLHTSNGGLAEIVAEIKRGLLPPCPACGKLDWKIIKAKNYLLGEEEP